MNSAVTIRPATVSDLDALILLGRKTFIETYQGKPNRPAGLEEIFGRENFNETKLLPSLRSGVGSNVPNYVLAFVGQEPAGFLKMEFGTPPICVPNANSIHLSEIYILQSFKGHGLGRRLFDECRAAGLAHGNSGLWLGVWDMNVEAIRFYEKQGMKAVGVIPWTFKHEDIDYTDNDIVMYLPLATDGVGK